MADRRLVEYLTQNRGNVGGGLGHDLADRGIWHRFEEGIRLGTGLNPVTQSFGFLLSRLDRRRSGSSRNDQNDLLHLVLERVALRLLISSGTLDGSHDVLFADLEALLVSSANETGPNHIGLQARLERLGSNALAFEGLR